MNTLKTRKIAAVNGDVSKLTEIYRAAAGIIFEKGFDATSMSDIAEAVGMTKAGIYHYIPGKKDLLFALMSYAMDRLEMQVIAPAQEIQNAELRLQSIIDNHVPKTFVVENGVLKGMTFEKVKAEYDKDGKRKLVPVGGPDIFMEADDVLIAVGQENSFPWIERDLGIEFDQWDMPKVDEVTFCSTNPKVFFGGDAAWVPKRNYSSSTRTSSGYFNRFNVSW